MASTAKTYLGTVIALLRQAGVEGDFKAPWLDEAPEADEMSDVVIPKEPGQSVLGCRFLRALLEEPDVMVEPETGSVRLATREARVTLAGAVLNELFRYLEEGAEILSAKIHVGTIPMRFDALSYRVSGLKLEPVKNEHWTIDLDQRLEQIAGVFEILDGKYAALKEKMNAVPGAVAELVEALRTTGADRTNKDRQGGPGTARLSGCVHVSPASGSYLSRSRHRNRLFDQLRHRSLAIGPRTRARLPERSAGASTFRPCGCRSDRSSASPPCPGESAGSSCSWGGAG